MYLTEKNYLSAGLENTPIDTPSEANKPSRGISAAKCTCLARAPLPPVICSALPAKRQYSHRYILFGPIRIPQHGKTG